MILTSRRVFFGPIDKLSVVAALAALFLHEASAP